MKSVTLEAQFTTVKALSMAADDRLGLIVELPTSKMCLAFEFR
jgi:hypothetical protein